LGVVFQLRAAKRDWLTKVTLKTRVQPSLGNNAHWAMGQEGSKPILKPFLKKRKGKAVREWGRAPQSPITGFGRTWGYEKSN